MNSELNTKTPASDNAPEPTPNLHERLIQGMLESHPELTRAEADEMLRAFGS